MSRAGKKAPRAYNSPLREAQAEATRERVVDAAIELLGRDPTSFTMPAVARAAGVSQPTVYRLFPDKEALTEAARASVRKRAGVDPSACHSSEELIARQGHSMRKIIAEPPEVLAAAAALNSQRLSDEQLQERIDYVMAALAKELRGVPKAARLRVAKLISMLYSSSGAAILWRYQLMNEEGFEAFAWMARTLIKAAQREGKCDE